MRSRRCASLWSFTLFACMLFATAASAATPCDTALHPNQCAVLDGNALPPFVHDALVAKGATLGAGTVLVLTSGDPNDPDTEISNDMGQSGCGTNPDGWDTFDCNLLDQFVPAEDSVVVALSSEWFEWYQTIFTDWMTIAGAGVPTVDVSINSWINNKVDVIPYGPMDTGVVVLTSLAKSKMVNFRVADSGDHIYDTAIVVVPATWFGNIAGSNSDPTLLCGNGTLEPGEECDDGNTITDDGCSSLCLGTQPPAPPPAPTTCGNLVYLWPTGLTKPYTCGGDLCGGFRCVVGNTISPACYTAAQCASVCAGSCVDIPVAQLDCGTFCSVQPPATEPPPVLPETCDALVYAFAGGTTAPYTCADDCPGERCVIGTTISPDCFDAGQCDASCADGTCVSIPTADCAEICALANVPATCTAGEVGQTRPAANQNGRCFGNVEFCDDTLVWKLQDGSWEPQDEMCNALDDDCNGVADDMFETCGDPGLCQNTVNTCDPANPGVPVVCEPLAPPSPVEICNNGLDDDCDGSADDGCECGDDECMPGETFETCPADCPPPPNGTPCEDGSLCTAGDAYQGGVCVPGAAVVCDQGNACVIGGACDPATGCTATKLDCNDDDPCTIDGCDAATGCTYAPDPACQAEDADGDGYASDVDCDDSDPAVNPGATEICNATDDDCEGGVDEGFDVGTPCQSAANDCGQVGVGSIVCASGGASSACNAVVPPNPPGYGDPCNSAPNDCGATAAGTVECNSACNAVTPPNPPGYGESCVSDPNDCGAIAPGTIQCNGACDAVTPPNPAGYGDPCSSAPNACGDTGEGTIQCDGACDAVAPPVPAEVCNGIDDDCDGQVDESIDSDNDGIGDCADACLDTKPDAAYATPVPSKRLLNNHWVLAQVGGTLQWVTDGPVKPNEVRPTLAFTGGCSCKQVLDALRAISGDEMNGPYYFGCTKGVLKDWNVRR